MNEGRFLSDPQVKVMVGWVQDRLDAPGSFCHSYRRRRPGGGIAGLDLTHWRRLGIDPPRRRQLFYWSAARPSCL